MKPSFHTRHKYILKHAAKILYYKSSPEGLYQFVESESGGGCKPAAIFRREAGLCKGRDRYLPCFFTPSLSICHWLLSGRGEQKDKLSCEHMFCYSAPKKIINNELTMRMYTVAFLQIAWEYGGNERELHISNNW